MSSQSMKTCMHCNKQFIKKNPYQKFCGKKCEEAYKNARYLPKEKVLVCPECHNNFETLRKKKYCCRECTLHANLRKTKERYASQRHTKKEPEGMLMQRK
jgi:hypothetical protein